MSLAAILVVVGVAASILSLIVALLTPHDPYTEHVRQYRRSTSHAARLGRRSANKEN